MYRDILIPVCTIELDDQSHNQKKRQQRDELLESVCESAGLSLYRVPAKTRRAKGFVGEAL